MNDLETRGMWAGKEPEPATPRKFLIVAHPGAGAILRARELAQSSRLWTSRDGVRMYAARVAGLPLPSGSCGHLRAPHHSVSVAGLMGTMRGHQWRPGEIALAHGGTLLLDEAPEFRLEALEAVNQAWRAKMLTYRSGGCTHGDVPAFDNCLTVPTEFDLVLTMTPCPCGWRGDTRPLPVAATCKCTDKQVARWFDRVAKIADGAERIDLEKKP